MTKETSKNGLYTEYQWWHEGQKSTESDYKDGKRHGKFHGWYKNGQKSFERNFKDGKRDGKVTCWYENGQKKYEDNYKDGKEDGKCTWWYENGQKKYEDNYKDGKRVTRIQWNENGQIEETGAEVEYYPDGQIKSKYVQYDLYAARFTSYYSNGNIESLGEYFPETDFGDKEIDNYDLVAARLPEKMGWWNYWYETGLIKAQCHYDQGAKDGLYIGFYKNGQKKIEKTYKSVEDESEDWRPYTFYTRRLSLKDGKETRWYANGQKKQEGNYKDDKKRGKFTVWDKNGQIKSETNYKNGKLID